MGPPSRLVWAGASKSIVPIPHPNLEASPSLRSRQFPPNSRSSGLARQRQGHCHVINKFNITSRVAPGDADSLPPPPPQPLPQASTGRGGVELTGVEAGRDKDREALGPGPSIGTTPSVRIPPRVALPSPPSRQQTLVDILHSLCPRSRWCDLSVDQRGPPLAMCEWSPGDSATKPAFLLSVCGSRPASSARARQPLR